MPGGVVRPRREAAPRRRAAGVAGSAVTATQPLPQGGRCAEDGRSSAVFGGRGKHGSLVTWAASVRRAGPAPRCPSQQLAPASACPTDEPSLMLLCGGSALRARRSLQGWYCAPLYIAPVSRAFPYWKRSILAEIYLCHACSCHEISRMKTPGQAAAIRGGALNPGACRDKSSADDSIPSRRPCRPQPCGHIGARPSRLGLGSSCAEVRRAGQRPRFRGDRQSAAARGGCGGPR
jgi:hypothetical protein